jgi:homoserine kinase type II
MLKGRAAAILSFLTGVSLRRPDATHCQAAGEAMARLHAAGEGFALSRANALGPAGWQELAAATAPRADAVQSELRVLIAQSLAALARDWPAGLPTGVIHADLFPDNVLFMGDSVSGLIDFYFACNDMLAYDLAVLINSWCFEPDGAYNITKGKAAIAGYRAVRTLSPGEVAAMPVLMRGAALRFLLTRLYDWLNPDPNALLRPKDPREYIRKLRFHLQVKSAGEYGF